MLHRIVLDDMNEYNRMCNNYRSGFIGSRGHFKVDDFVEICCGAVSCMFLVAFVYPHDNNSDIIMLAKMIKFGVFEELN